jgi:hypothetical protein
LNCGILLTLNYLSTKKPVKARHPSLFDFPWRLQNLCINYKLLLA